MILYTHRHLLGPDLLPFPCLCGQEEPEMSQHQDNLMAGVIFALQELAAVLRRVSIAIMEEVFTLEQHFHRRPHGRDLGRVVVLN